jgi:hypothetical protein
MNLNSSACFAPLREDGFGIDPDFVPELIAEPEGLQHLYWPGLEVDLVVESVLHPERYPLVSRVNEAGEGYAPVEGKAEWDQDKVDDVCWPFFS